MKKINRFAEEYRKEQDFQHGFGTGEKRLYVRKKKKSLLLKLNIFRTGVEQNSDKHL